ncbi:MAG: ABC transporter ATP-binding protein [Burkholderiales bacterium]
MMVDPTSQGPGATTTIDPPLVQLDNVHKKFGNGTMALRGMSLAIGPREFVSFLGPSGCGKSTALRLIAGLSEPSAGRIVWNRPRSAENTQEIGFVFQEPTLMPWATVSENIYLPLRVKHIGRREARPHVDEALAMVGLESFRESYPRELSGGMKMRVSIARALVTRPKLLLMDEPFAALDEITRFKLNDDLLALWERNNWTVIFVTHSVYESVYLSSRVIVMAPRPGRVIADRPIVSPYPRDEAYRTSAAYGEACRDISAVLRRPSDHVN